MKDFSVIKWHEETVDNAVRLSKLNFVEYYTKHGYPPNDTGRAWHELRVSKKGRDRKDELKRQIPGLTDVSAFINTDAPDKPAAEKKTKKKAKEVEKDIPASENHGLSKKELIIALYEQGVTKPGDIKKELGFSNTYISKTLKAYKEAK